MLRVARQIDPIIANKFSAPVSRIRSVIFSPATWVAVTVALLCVVLQLAGFQPDLRFDRGAIAAGHWWLLLSGNLVHFGPAHLLMNLGGLALVYTLVWQNFNAIEWITIIVLTSLGVGLGLYWRDPDIFWYVGFSGTLHGLIIAGTFGDFRRFPVQAALLLALITAKLVWEQIGGSLPGSAAMAGGDVAVNAHLYGALSGTAVGGLLFGWQRVRQTPP